MKQIFTRIFAVLILVALVTVAYADDRHDASYYYTNARACYKANKWAEGKKLADEGLRYYSTFSNINELEGWYFYHFKKYDQARFYLIRALRTDKENTHARELLINVEDETKNYSSAICYVNEMLEREPYELVWWRRKIDLYRRQGNNDEADRLLSRLRIIYPDQQQVKADYNYLLETRYRNARKAGNVSAQIQALREIVKNQPKDEEYYLVLSNLLIQTGRSEEAAEVASEGVAVLGGNMTLIRKKVGILTEAGRFTEALSYIQSCQRLYKSAALASLYKDVELEAAEAAKNNDAYTMYSRIYATNKSAETLNYLLNTAIARGYYEDALTYLRDARQSHGETEEVLYKEYIVNQRLGNKTTANNLLVKLYEKNPRNVDIADLLAGQRFEKAAEAMAQGSYVDAIPNLNFVMTTVSDPDTKKAAMLRLFNCYLLNRDYAMAETMLDSYNSTYGYNSYNLQKAQLLSMQGKVREALDKLYRDYRAAANDKDRELIAGTYEEMATPYIKTLIQRGAIHQAFDAVEQAAEVCPKSADILHMAITTSALLKNDVAYRKYVEKARTIYPEDPEFVAKEAGIYALDKDYERALKILRPQLDIYAGDSTLIGAFSENSELYALNLRRNKNPYQAMAVIDTALVFDHNNRALLYTKGLIFEDIHQYDSAYVYQSYYDMTFLDYTLVKRHLNEILYKSFHQELILEYQQARLGSEDAITGNASLSYLRKFPLNTYTGTLNYAGRDGAVNEPSGTDLTEGGVGVQLNAAWEHVFRPDLRGKAELALANKYFPQWVIKVGGTLELPKEWTVGAGLAYRRIKSYKGIYGWKQNDNGQGGTTLEYQRIGWKASRMNMLTLNGNVTKTIDKFALTGGLDLVTLNLRHLYYNLSAKMQFFPVVGDRSHIFAGASVGNSPATVLIDRSLPAGFNHINTSVSLGGLYVYNQHLSFGLSGSWYTLYNKKEGLYTGLYETNPSILASYRNYFYVHLQVFIAF